MINAFAKKARKENKGVTINDLVIAIIIITIFVGVIGSIFYQVVYHAISIKIKAVVTNYAISILEWTDKLRIRRSKCELKYYCTNAIFYSRAVYYFCAGRKRYRYTS